jgi:hypothetical protein
MLSERRHGQTGELPPLKARDGPRDYAKWSTLSYSFGWKEDRDAEEALQAGRDRRQAAAG